MDENRRSKIHIVVLSFITGTIFVASWGMEKFYSALRDYEYKWKYVDTEARIVFVIFAIGFVIFYSWVFSSLYDSIQKYIKLGQKR